MRGHAFSMSRPDRSRCFTSFPLGDICVGVSSAVRVVGRRRGGAGGEEGEESDTRTGALPFYGGVNFLTVLSGKAAERAIQSS